MSWIMYEKIFHAESEFRFNGATIVHHATVFSADDVLIKSQLIND